MSDNRPDGKEPFYKAPYRSAMEPEVVIEVKITRKFGDVEITYGLSAPYYMPTFENAKQAFDEIREIVENQHELALQNRPELVPNSMVSHVSQNEAIVYCTHVRKESIQGKDRIRLLGGEFTTHGIAVYPEFFAALQINPDALGYGDTDYSKNVMIHLDGRGNPKRAVAVVP